MSARAADTNAAAMVKRESRRGSGSKLVHSPWVEVAGIEG